MRELRRRAVQCWGILIASTALACGGDDSASSAGGPRVFTGEVPGTDARVGVIASEHQALVFFCGGESSYESLTRWFSATVDGAGHIEGQNESWRLDGQLEAGGISGSFEADDGTPRLFLANAVREGTIAGLYEGAAPCGRLGLIVSQGSAGELATGQGACVGPPTVEQVNPLSPIVRAPDGSIRVNVEGSIDELLVRGATLSGR